MNDRQSTGATSEQLALELPPAKSLARDDLISGAANALALELIDAWPDWPGNVVILAGPVGSGKSHIGAAWAARAKAIILPLEQLPRLRDNRDNQRPLLLEDAREGTIDEPALFHVLNAKRSANASIIITSRSWPSDWRIGLADLNSRLRAAHLVELGEPDDALLRGVLCKLFADRQLSVDANVIDFLVVRMERSLEAANQLVRKIDALALEKRRRITRQLVGEVLTNLEGGE